MIACLLAFLLGAAPHAPAAPAATAAPTVTITSPSGGWTTNRVVKISGSVSDASLRLGRICVNGSDRPLPLRSGSFDISLVLSPGLNVIEVTAGNAVGEGRAKVSLFAKVPKMDLRLVLSWDTDGTDLDLHVLEPNGEESWYGHRETRSGGALDVDVTDGYGPEIYTQASAQPGEYLVSVDYFSDHGHAQTEVKVDVLLWEGTEREERQSFHKMLTRTGGKMEVGRFTVKDRRKVE